MMCPRRTNAFTRVKTRKSIVLGHCAGALTYTGSWIIDMEIEFHLVSVWMCLSVNSEREIKRGTETIYVKYQSTKSTEKAAGPIVIKTQTQWLEVQGPAYVWYVKMYRSKMITSCDYMCLAYILVNVCWKLRLPSMLSTGWSTPVLAYHKTFTWQDISGLIWSFLKQ